LNSKKKNAKPTDKESCHVKKESKEQASEFLLILALFIVGDDFLAMKIISETTEIKVIFSNLIKLSMKFRSL
jgi:hypothetical protein